MMEGVTWGSIPVPVVLDKCTRGSESLQGLLEILEGRFALGEASYTFSRTVSTKNLHELEMRKSSSERTMGFLKNYYLYLAMEQLKQQRALKGESVLGRLSELKSGRNVVIQRNRNLIENSYRDVKHAGEMLNKAKLTFLKAKQECAQHREKLSACERAVEMASAEKLAKESEAANRNEASGARNKSFSKMFSSAFENTPEMERDKQEKRVGKRIQELIAASADIKTKKAILTEKISVRDFSIQQAAQALQEVEITRLQVMKQVVTEFCALERSAMLEQSKLLKQLEDVVAEQTPEKDMSEFIAQEKRPEATLKYTRALALLDWDLMRRGGDSADVNIGQLFDEGESSLSAAPATDEDVLQASVWRDTTQGDGLTQAGGSREEDQVTTTPVTTNIAEPILLSPIRSDTLQRPESPFELGTAPTKSGLETPALHSRSTTSSPSSQESPVFSPGSLSPSPTSVECQKTLKALSMIFPSSATESEPAETNADEIDYSESEWGVIMEQADARELFLQALDEKRGMSQLSRRSFDVMAMAMTSVLNASLQSDDVKSAMRVANMANTFYCERDAGDVSDAESDDSLGAAAIPAVSFSATASVSGDSFEDVPVSNKLVTPEPEPKEKEAFLPTKSSHKKYLQREPSIRHHKWWASEGFWEKALMEGVAEQMALRPPVRWEDLSQEALREAVMGKLVDSRVGGDVKQFSRPLYPPPLTHTHFPPPPPFQRCTKHCFRSARRTCPVDARVGPQEWRNRATNNGNESRCAAHRRARAAAAHEHKKVKSRTKTEESKTKNLIVT